MPQLDELVKERKTKKFIKKSYRPWDLTGNQQPSSDATPETQEDIHPSTTVTNSILV